MISLLFTGERYVFYLQERIGYKNKKFHCTSFIKKNISPCKGDLELWYQENLSFYTDLMIILITAYKIFVPNNNLINLVFKDLTKKNNL